MLPLASQKHVETFRVAEEQCRFRRQLLFRLITGAALSTTGWPLLPFDSAQTAKITQYLQTVDPNFGKNNDMPFAVP